MLRAVLAAQPGAATAAAPAAKAAIAESQAGALRSSAPAKTDCSPTHHEPLHKRKRPASAPAQPEDIAVIRMPAWKPSQHLTRIQVAGAQHFACAHLQTVCVCLLIKHCKVSTNPQMVITLRFREHPLKRLCRCILRIGLVRQQRTLTPCSAGALQRACHPSHAAWPPLRRPCSRCINEACFTRD